MIRTGEALLLARTKLKVRKIRLGITVVISSLLFAVLVFLAAVTSGVTNSLQDFGREGYGSKYMVQAMPLTYMPRPDDQALISRFAPVERDMAAKKTAAAKKLGVTYDATTDMSLPLLNVGPNKDQQYLNYQSQPVVDELKKRNDSIPGTGYEDFAAIARKAGASGVYRGTARNYSYGWSGGAQQLKVIVDGKEKFEDPMKSMQQPSYTGVDSINSLGWRSADAGLLMPFVLPGQTLAVQKDGSIPIIAPYSAAEEILGLKALPQTATPQEKLQRLSEVRQQIAGHTAQLCYRNSASTALVTQTIQQQEEIDANKDKKDYVKPSRIYQLPDVPCGPVTVKSDTRSWTEKQQDANEQKFKQEFGEYIEPKQSLMTIRIVGISPDTSMGPSLSASNVLTSLLSSSVGSQWVSPSAAITGSAVATAAQGSNVETAGHDSIAYYAVFDTADAMKSFMKSQTCKTIQTIQTPMGPMPEGGPMGNDQVNKCAQAGKAFSVMTYGNSAAAIDDFKHTVWNVAKFVVLAVVVIASIIMMGNVGKIIADSRRETAVFRALGARRIDIVQLYVLYAVLVSLLVGICGEVLGSIGAAIVNHHFSPDLSVSAVLAYNAADLHKQFVLTGFNWKYTGAILCLVVLCGLISASLPLLTNMRRNPIGDMRDDS